jgi:MFS family permease
MKKVPQNVFILGLVSLFNDMASEMIYPIVPIFLTSVLGAPVSVVGLIEGIAEATASIGKFFFGYWSDRAGKRKIFVTMGYSFGAVSKLLMGFATAWPLVLFARFIDRTGKGLRTGARDSLLLQNATSQNKGFIFGFHRAMDSMGAVLGPLIALGLLYYLPDKYQLIFLIAFIPGVIAILLLVIFVHEKRQESTKKQLPKLDFSLLTRDKHFLYFFIVSMLFSVGNSSDSFLLLRAKDLGFSTTLVVLTYVLYNVSQTVFATPAGSLSDKIGAKKVYAGGLLVFSIVYFLFGFINHPTLIWILFPIYGIYIAATDGVSKAYISEFITEGESGTYFGLYQMGTAVASFLASFVGGLLWTQFGAQATFYYGSIMAFIAFLLLMSGRLTKKV